MLLLRTELKETLVQDEGLPVVNYNGKLLDYILLQRVVTLPKCFHSDSSSKYKDFILYSVSL